MGSCSSIQTDHPTPIKTALPEERLENFPEPLEDKPQKQPVEKSPEPPEPPEKNTPEPSEESDDDLEKGSDFLFEMENVKNDQVKIIAVKDDYPQPTSNVAENQKTRSNILWFEDWSPQIKTAQTNSGNPHTSSSDITQDFTMSVDPTNITIEDVDRIAKNAPSSVSGSFQDLVQYLTRNLQKSPQREMLTARAIIIWLSSQNVYQLKNGIGNQDTPEGFLILLGKNKTTYSTFFTVLCREAGLKCVRISGVAKCGSYVPGDKDLSKFTTVWNAVYIDGMWKIVNPFWTCVSLVGYQAGGWIKLEAGGKAVGQRQEASAGVLRNAFKEYYFMPNPYEYIFRCHPDDEAWQLIENPKSREDFTEMPYLLPTFFGLGLQLKSEQKCLLHANMGSLSINIQAPLKNANALNMWYEIFLKEGSSSSSAENEMCRPENIPRLVAMIRNGEIWKFNVQFPIEGTYKFCLYAGPHKSSLLRVSEFRLDCDRRKDSCVPLPFNPGIVGFGPGPSSEEAGLFLPSHKSGFISARKRSEIKIMFHTKESLSVKSELIDHKTKLESSVDCNFNRDRKLLRLTAQITQDGDYSLRIATASGRSSVKEQSFKYVCNYFVSTRDQSNEPPPKRFARRAMEQAYESGNIEELQSSISKCIKEKIDPDDDQILASRSRLEFLETKKVIHDALLTRHAGVVKKAIDTVQSSQFLRILQTELHNLDKLRQTLVALGDYTQPPPDLPGAITELTRLMDPSTVILQITRALMVLLGQPENSVKTWGQIVDILHSPKGRRYILDGTHEVRNNIHLLTSSNVKKAREIIQQYQLTDVQRINMAAVAIYNATDEIIQQYDNSGHGSS